MIDHQMDIARCGLAAAIKRMSSGIADALIKGNSLPLETAEALWWTIWIDERFFYQDKGGYPGSRDKYVGNKLFDALRYVRDRCTHQSPVVLNHDPGGWTMPIVFPITGPSVVWDHPDNMGEPQLAKPEKSVLVADLITGQSVMTTFQVVLGWYQQMGLDISVQRSHEDES